MPAYIYMLQPVGGYTIRPRVFLDPDVAVARLAMLGEIFEKYEFSEDCVRVPVSQAQAALRLRVGMSIICHKNGKRVADLYQHEIEG